MEHFNIRATRNTPSVSYDPRINVFRLIGNSIPENASEFYTPVIEWLKRESRALPDGATFEFCLPYFNSSSLKALYLLLVELKKAMDAGKRFEAIWHVEEGDDFMSEAAETFTELAEIQFSMRAGLLPVPKAD